MSLLYRPEHSTGTLAIAIIEKTTKNASRIISAALFIFLGTSSSVSITTIQVLTVSIIMKHTRRSSEIESTSIHGIADARLMIIIVKKASALNSLGVLYLM